MLLQRCSYQHDKIRAQEHVMKFVSQTGFAAVLGILKCGWPPNHGFIGPKDVGERTWIGYLKKVTY